MLMLDRRTLLRAGSAAVGAAALAPTAPALAHAPQAGKRAQPSFYRFKLGTIEITVVSDGTLAFPAETLWGDRANEARGLLTSTFHTPRPVGLQINTLLVNTGDKLVLIDAGCGADKLPSAQQPRVTQTNLKLAGPRLHLIKAGAEVAPGVTTFDTAGHTPGHISVRISSGSEQMLLTGDVVVDSEVSFLHPE